MTQDADYRLIESFPGPDDYRRLRSAAGLSRKTEAAAARGLANTVHGVSVLHGDGVHDEHLVGMGRLVGDGGCFFFVVDIAVEPAHQRRGLGKRIMAALDAWLRTNAPDSAHVALFADGEARQLYAQFGFVENRVSIGMDYVVGRRPR